jgi:hypothetical protein
VEDIKKVVQKEIKANMLIEITEIQNKIINLTFIE